ncbi:MAG: hypothetical protein ACI30V_02625 [Muribaculaceae bacterium]
MKKIYIKKKTRRKEEFQFFMHDFVDSCVEYGFEAKHDLFPSYRWHIRGLCRELLWHGYKFVKQHFHWLMKRNYAMIVTANGVTLPDNVFPYYGCCEIVPMLWDVWPSTWGRMYAAFEALDVKTVLVSSSQVAEMINRETKVRAYWIPEGINAKLYRKGAPLLQREYDVYEMGRRLEKYHIVLQRMSDCGMINRLQTSNLNPDGTLDDGNVALTNEELYGLMPWFKVLICFPQCDTNPQRAGDIETLTQRYWEAMLSGCLMVGRAPKELVDLIGYNPVIDVDWENPVEQMKDILEHIADYQSLVDRNYQSAINYADWSKRMPLIVKCLEDAGYKR